jgi:DNA-binding NtrC family response regulator
MKRVISLNDADEISSEHLHSELPQSKALPELPQQSVLLGGSIREVERQLLEKALETTKGNRTRAAELLGISLRTVRNKIREYGLPPRRYA